MGIIKRFVRGMIYGSGEPTPRSVKLKGSKRSVSTVHLPITERNSAMEKFDWLEKLEELAAQCAPEGWELHSKGDNHGANIWRYHRYDEARNIDFYVELAAMTYPLSNDAEVEISIGGKVRDPEPFQYVVTGARRGEKHVRLSTRVQPEFFPGIAEHLQRAYQEVSRLNPVD